MDRISLPPIEFLHECFSYDPGTGELRWKLRPAHHFISVARANNRNSRYAGQIAGSVGEYHRQVRFAYAGKTVSTSAHRIAFKLLTGEDPAQIDHINVDGLDNRAANLRAAGRGDNNANRRGWAKSGLPKGVKFVNRTFVAQITKSGRTHYLGRFASPEQAHNAFCEAARRLHGEFFNPGISRASVFD